MLVEENGRFARRVEHSFPNVDWVIANSMSAARDAIARRRFDGYVVDPGRPGPDDGWNLVEQLRARSGETPILILTASEALDVVDRAQRLGVELAFKRSWNAAVACFIRRASQTLRVRVRAFAEHFALTPRQTEILGHYVDDQDPDEIAELLEISEQTVRTHLKAVLAQSRAGRLSAIRKLIRRRPIEAWELLPRVG